MADPNYNWLIPQNFSFTGNPFEQYKKYFGSGGQLTGYDPSQGPITEASGDTGSITYVPRAEDAWMATPELAALDPRWNDRTQMEVIGAGDGYYDVKLKTGDKEGTIVRIQKDPETNTWGRGDLQGTVGWNTNSPAIDPRMAAVIAAPFAVAGAQALFGGALGGATGAGTTAASTAGWSLPTLAELANGAVRIVDGIKYVWNGAKWVAGAIGAANTISNVFTGNPVVGNNGHLIDTGGNTNTNTGSNNVTTPAPPGSNTGTNPTNPTTPGSGNFDLNTLFNFFLSTGGQAISAGRQENMADQFLAMYNDAKKQAEPWEEKLRQSYTPEGQQALLSSPEFMGQLDAYKTGLDRKASRYGTLTNPETGIQGAERGRTWALQQKAYGLLGDYRKPIQDQIDLYTKNAADYKMLAAFGLASEANIPGQWAQTLAKQFGTGDGQIDWNKVFRSADTVIQAGGNLVNWWNDLLAGGRGEDVDNTQEDPGGDIGGTGVSTTGDIDAQYNEFITQYPELANDPDFDYWFDLFTGGVEGEG